ncbi:Ran-binding protein 9/10, partial [Tremellales sp. Uapishka_1]
MDTSTLSFSHLDSSAEALTTSSYRLEPRPINTEWLTRLISNTDPAAPKTTPLLTMQEPNFTEVPPTDGHGNGNGGYSTLLLVFIPIMVVILTVLLGLLVFLMAILYLRRRKGIRLTEDGGPLDLSKSDGVMGEGGVEGVEARWLETVDPDVREAYKKAKEYQLHHLPSSTPSDITLSQFLSIQEKGVSAWAFEPEYEDNLALYVQGRTEITFMADGPGMSVREGGGVSVMANLPLPKLNEVYYWEVKLYEKPANTEVAIGLATKPFPSFRLPGWNKYSVAYFASDGFKSHNYPFTGASYGPPLAEGDVLGVGYRPRTGTVFFTRNGRKMEDAYSGLQRFNLFPTVGANGSCTLSVNLGQSGFVFIEANVKKWGLAPMVGTLAPPPAYGSERGSILLAAGYGTPGANTPGAGMSALMEAARARSSTPNSIPSTPSNRSVANSRRHRRAGRTAALSVPAVSSPLRGGQGGPGPATAGSRRRALVLRGGEEYASPTDTQPMFPVPASIPSSDDDEEEVSDYESISEYAGSPVEHNPPTPNLLDISLHSMRGSNYFGGREEDDGGSGSGSGSGASDETARPENRLLDPPRLSPPPPGYSPLDPHVYDGGLPADLPDHLINEAIAAMSGMPVSPPPREERNDSEEHATGPLGWLIGRRG